MKNLKTKTLVLLFLFLPSVAFPANLDLPSMQPIVERETLSAAFTTLGVLDNTVIEEGTRFNPAQWIYFIPEKAVQKAPIREAWIIQQVPSLSLLTVPLQTPFQPQQPLDPETDFRADFELTERPFSRQSPLSPLDLRRNRNITGENEKYQMGDFYVNFSPFVLKKRLRGVNSEFSPAARQTFQAFLAEEPVTVNHQAGYQTMGGRMNYLMLKDTSFFSSVRLGLQGVSTWNQVRDRRVSNNTVYSMDGEINFIKYLSLDYELAQSEKQKAVSSAAGDILDGAAFRIEPKIHLTENLDLRYTYHYTEPGFVTYLGSIDTNEIDRVKHEVAVDWKPREGVWFSVGESYSWNHLAGQETLERTYYDERFFSVKTRPFEGRKDLWINHYLSHVSTLSSRPDRPGTQANYTTAGFSLNDRFWGAYTSLFYERHGYENEYERVLSEDLNRFGATLGRDFRVGGRKCYLGSSLSADFREYPEATRQSGALIGLSFSGNYELLANCQLRFGHDAYRSKSTLETPGYLNLNSFLELDFVLSKKRQAHLISRLERDFYDADTSFSDTRETV